MTEKKSFTELLSRHAADTSLEAGLRRRSEPREPRAFGRLRRLADALRVRGDSRTRSD